MLNWDETLIDYESVSLTYLLVHILQNVINLRWRVIFAELVEAVVEELGGVRVRAEDDVLPPIKTASIIAKPDVVALLGEYDGERVRTLHNPS